jgi:hypothetical protein
MATDDTTEHQEESGAETLSLVTMERLGFLRYLYEVGLEQSRQPEPLAAVSILSFHDSVDLFLQLASEQSGATLTIKKPYFSDYFAPINEVIKPEQLSNEQSMKRLNNARNAVKHNSFVLAWRDVEQLRAGVTGFFEDNTPLIFGIEFGAISLVSLVRCEPARQKLQEAESYLQAGNREEALVAIAVAFVELINDYERAASSRYGRSPFTFGESFAFESSFFRQDPFSDPFSVSFDDKVMNSIVSLQDAMKILGLGIDYRRYTKFRLLTPNVSTTTGSGRHDVSRHPRGSADPPSYVDCRFCFDFVIDAAIRLQDLDPTVEEI